MSGRLKMLSLFVNRTRGGKGPRGGDKPGARAGGRRRPPAGRVRSEAGGRGRSPSNRPGRTFIKWSGPDKWVTTTSDEKDFQPSQHRILAVLADPSAAKGFTARVHGCATISAS